MKTKSANKQRNKTILIKDADYVVTVNNKGDILRNTSILIEGNKIKKFLKNKVKADRTINASGMVVVPGFINTHLHTPQVFHRHCPAQQNKPIAQWIKVTTSINKEINDEAMYYGALICFAELMFSGVTTSLDYFYPFVKNNPGTFEAMLKAAKDIGIRLTAIRGSMSQSKKQGTLYDETVVEDLEATLIHSKKMIEKYHDPLEFAMIRIGVGPCLPFASVEQDYIESAKLARKYKKVTMQTHVSESEWEVQYCEDKFGTTPIRLMEKTNFLGRDVSLVHCNIISNSEIKLLGKTKTNIVLTPICNTRDASDGNGIAPINNLLKYGSNISIGVDGPASNDSMNILDEMRYLRVVAKAKEGLFWHRNENQAKYSYMNPSDVFRITNHGGATTLNREDIGTLEVGKAADVVIFNPKKELSHAGVVNPWGGLISCQAIKPQYLIINGKIIVNNGQFLNINIERIIDKFRQHHKKIIEKTQRRLGFSLVNYIN